MHQNLFSSIIRIGIIIFLIISFQGLIQAKEIHEDFPKKISNNSIILDPIIFSNLFNIPFQFENINVLKQKSNLIDITSDNSSSV